MAQCAARGLMLPAEGQLFVTVYDTVGYTPIYLILNGVPLPKASMLDGLVMGAALNAALWIAASDKPQEVLPKAVEAFHILASGFLAEAR